MTFAREDPREHVTGFALQSGSWDATTSQHGTITGQVAAGHSTFVPGCSVVAGAPGAPGTNAGRGFAAALAADCVAHPEADVQLRYTLLASDAWCYLPLYKRTSWSYQVRIEITGALAASSVVEGSVTQRSYGFEPCRAFDERLGRVAADAARAEGVRLVRQLRDASAAGAASAVSTPARRAPRSAPGSR